LTPVDKGFFMGEVKPEASWWEVGSGKWEVGSGKWEVGSAIYRGARDRVKLPTSHFPPPTPLKLQTNNFKKKVSLFCFYKQFVYICEVKTIFCFIFYSYFLKIVLLTYRLRSTSY